MTLKQAITKVEQLARMDGLGSSTTEEIIDILKWLDSGINERIQSKLQEMLTEANQDYLDYFLERGGSVDDFNKFAPEGDDESNAWEAGYLYGLGDALKAINSFKN